MTTKLCNFCGKEIPENSKICPYCNKALADKVFTYMKSDSSSNLDVSKYIKEEKNEANNYFNTNIYSFSENEIEKRFERKPVVYEEDRTANQVNYNKLNQSHREQMPVRQRKKQKNLLFPVVGVAVVIIAIICIAIAIASGGGEDENIEQTTVLTTTTTTVQTTTTTVAQTSTTQNIISASSVDLDGYIGVVYENVSDHFGEQIKDSASDEFYGGNIYYYDGMTISTSSNGKIASMTVDYTTVQNKDTYRYLEITYYSTYNHVIDELGAPTLDQMQDPIEPCIGYTLDKVSKLSIKFRFDDNNKVSGFDMFYAD